MTLILDAALPWLVRHSSGVGRDAPSVPATLCGAFTIGVLVVGIMLNCKAPWARKSAMVAAALALPVWALVALRMSMFLALLLHGMEGSGAEWWPGLVASAIIFGPVGLLPNVLLLRYLIQPDVVGAFGLAREKQVRTK